ncbi:alkylmercury lyase family protein [Tissierella sp. MSJ-40]|uniref:Alkylmercury lyase family protein n=3 Tax=Tissierella simiarum TaxID=2841534 RepID=A0ABS6E0W2_9FIRM|nr:alkylmercury lyase family protein [Tissierella simiarum]
MERLNYRYYTNEQLAMDSIDSRLIKEEKILRRHLMNCVINKGQSLDINDVYEVTSDIKIMDKEVVDKIIGNLLKKNAIVIDEERNVNFIYPVSAIPTNHKVILADGRQFSAMCAIDAMGTAFTFKQDVNIESKCSNCGADIKVSIRNGKLDSYEPTDLHILHVDLNKNLNWSGNC